MDWNISAGWESDVLDGQSNAPLYTGRTRNIEVNGSLAVVVQFGLMGVACWPGTAGS